MEQTSMKKVGLIGLGAMGRGVAKNLLQKGFGVVGADVDPRSLEWLREQGGDAAAGAQAIAEACTVVITFVVNDRQTEQVLFGADALVGRLKPGTVVVTCSTMAPAYVRSLGERLADHGLRLVDAPVTGGMAGAEKGTLTIMAAGERQTFEEVKPVLAAFGARIFHLGEEPGMGSQMKVVNQLLCGIHIVAAAEGLALAKQHGLPLDTTLEILRSGSASSWMLGDRGPRMVREAFDEVTSAVDIFVKDMGLVLDAARESRFAAPLAHTAFLSFLAASGKGWGGLDDSAVMRNYETGAHTAD